MHNKINSDTGANYKNKNNDSYDVRSREHIERPKMKMSVAIAISALLIVITLLGATLTVISFSKNTKKGDKENENVVSFSKDINKEDKENEKVIKQETFKMYVDCDVDVPFKESAEENAGTIGSIFAGSAVETYDEENNGYTKIRYNGKDGYVESQYLSSTRPFVWNYKDEEVESFVEDVLYGYTNAITTGDITYITDYLYGKAIQDAYDTHERVTSLVDREEVIDVECSNVTRISKTRVTVERISTIRLYYYDGRVKDVTEKYLTTVEKKESSEDMKVIEFLPME